MEQLLIPRSFVLSYATDSGTRLCEANDSDAALPAPSALVLSAPVSVNAAQPEAADLLNVLVLP